jgi:trk system potassium uptake protein TrkA
MHITVLGASRFGVATAKQLIEEGHEVVLIDVDKDMLDELADDLDCGMIHGDGTLPSVLRDAYGDGSDALISLTNEDDVNILASVVGRSVGYPRVVPQIVRPELMSVVHELDLDDAITPHESVARSIVAALTQHSEVDTDMSLSGELRIAGQRIHEGQAGQTLGELDLPNGTQAIAHIRGEDESFAGEDIELEEGDRLLFVVRKDTLGELNEFFEEE